VIKINDLYVNPIYIEVIKLRIADGAPVIDLWFNSSASEMCTYTFKSLEERQEVVDSILETIDFLIWRDS